MASMPPERGLWQALERAEFPTKRKGPLARTAAEILSIARREAQAATR